MKNQDHFEVLRKMQEKLETPQRKLAEELGFSLGKLNYCLKALQQKGLVKLENFKKQSNKINYLQYVITRKGITERTKLTINFMKKKMKEKKMSYGEGLIYISEVDIWKDKLRIKVVDLGNEKKEQWIFMSPREAEFLVNDIWLALKRLKSSIEIL